MTPFEEKLLAAGMKEIGAPYIWGAKGDCIWSPVGSRPLTLALPNGPHAFDCSGFVQWCLMKAGQADRRMAESANTMFSSWTPVNSATALEAQPLAAFYGVAPHASHIAILVSMYGNIWSLEAAGGDQNTTVPKPSACVRFGPVLRRDLLGMRKLPQT